MKIYKILGIVCIFVGAVLLGSNFLGFYFFRTIEQDNPYVINPESRALSADEFWENVAYRDDELAYDYADRVSKAISKRVITLNSDYLYLLKPTFFENWFLWFYVRENDFFQWIDAERAIRLGGGICSHQSIVFNQILNDAGEMSFILGLGGHVLNEVAINGKLLVFDPDYGISHSMTLEQLEGQPELVYKRYKAAGATDQMASHISQAFKTKDDNWRMRSSEEYGSAGTRQDLIEPVSYTLIWIIPLGLILCGIRVSRKK